MGMGIGESWVLLFGASLIVAACGGAPTSAPTGTATPLSPDPTTVAPSATSGPQSAAPTTRPASTTPPPTPLPPPTPRPRQSSVSSPVPTRPGGTPSVSRRPVGSIPVPTGAVARRPPPPIPTGSGVPHGRQRHRDGRREDHRSRFSWGRRYHPQVGFGIPLAWWDRRLAVEDSAGGTTWDDPYRRARGYLGRHGPHVDGTPNAGHPAAFGASGGGGVLKGAIQLGWRMLSTDLSKQTSASTRWDGMVDASSTSLPSSTPQNYTGRSSNR